MDKTESFKIKMNEVNPSIKILSEYINNRTKVSAFCEEHQIEWQVIPRTLLEGSGCKGCKKDKFLKSIQSKQKEYQEEFEKKVLSFGIYKVIGEYKGSNEKVMCKCLNCEEENLIIPGNLLKGQGCKNCANVKIGKERVKSHDDFIKELKIINSNVEIISEYKGNKKNIKTRCLSHQLIWDASPRSLLLGGGCKECRKEKISLSLSKDHQTFVQEMEFLHENIKVIGKYEGNSKPLQCECKVCNNTIYPMPSNLLRGQGCKHCGINSRANKRRTSLDSINTRIRNVNPNISLIGDFNIQNAKSEFECKRCGEQWSTKVLHVLNGHGCPRCNSSKGEKMLEEVLKGKNIDFVKQKRFDDCKNKRSLPFDFYLPELNVCIEYDGIQHYEPVDFFGGMEIYKYTKENDNIKDGYCKENGIKLIRISYKNDNTDKIIECLDAQLLCF